MCYLIFASLTFMLFSFGIVHEMYKRSISTFLSISSMFLFVMGNTITQDMNAVATSKLWLILCIGETLAYTRAMYKHRTDKVVAW